MEEKREEDRTEMTIMIKRIRGKSNMKRMSNMKKTKGKKRKEEGRGKINIKMHTNKTKS